MSASVTISVMICTKDREQDAKELLDCLVKQTCCPNQVVIVDAGAQSELSTYLAATQFPFECRYIHTEPAVMRQRNIGIANCVGKFIVCLDDDLLLDADFIAEMLKPLRAQPPGALSAVIGRIVDDGSWWGTVPWRARVNHYLRRLLVNMFLLDKIGDGRFRYSGLATYPRDEQKSRYVDCVAGGCVVYRREVFDQFHFDENFVYPPLDDLDTSKRLMDAGHKVYYQPSARVLHKKSISGRLPRYNLYQVWVTHHYYMFRKNWPQTPLRRLAFWWSVPGILLINISRPEQFKGVLSGIANIRATKSPVEAMKNLASKT